MEANLVGDPVRDQRVQLRHAIVQLHKVRAERVDGVVIGTLRLYAAGRIPAQTMIKPANVVFRGYLPIELRRIDQLIAESGDRAQV